MQRSEQRTDLAEGAADQQARLERHVRRLAGEIGPRNSFRYEALQAAAAYIERSLAEIGLAVSRQTYEVRGKPFANLVAELPGQSQKDEIVVIGAHYDTNKNSPGADDNASAVAGLLELARHFAPQPLPRTLRFVAFTNEEAPFTRRKNMGSRVYAKACRERGDKLVGMICLESIGYYSEKLGSQWLSFWGRFLPRRGDFLALVANRHSRELLARVQAKVKDSTAPYFFPLVLPSHVPGAWSSDHWSFWREGFPALMVTDTVPLRNPYYHTRQDTPDKVKFDWLNRAVDALKPAIADLADGP